MLWFNFILGLNFTSLCFKLIIIYYHAPKQREIKFKPRIKLNHNIDKRCHVSMSCFVEACSNPILSVKLIFFLLFWKLRENFQKADVVEEKLKAITTYRMKKKTSWNLETQAQYQHLWRAQLTVSPFLFGRVGFVYKLWNYFHEWNKLFVNPTADNHIQLVKDNFVA